MKQDIVLAGVGGQGILTIAYIIDNTAQRSGLQFKQVEVHGMAQRGGAVVSHVRLSDQAIFSDLIPKGAADLILSVEPLEALRYIDFLAPEGTVVTSINPYDNIPDYPDIIKVRDAVKEISRHVFVDSGELSGEAGSSKSQNMVMLGAASRFLVLKEKVLLESIEELFKVKGDQVIDINKKAFRLGKKAAENSK
ncbi:MAG: indolepyruvate oxidoreductase subunit beta [Candidatus Aminicenantes bacterium]|nr:indolepyruvate oxidoreductase subunit beta [Candidatus Aminicenantes bacterium]